MERALIKMAQALEQDRTDNRATNASGLFALEASAFQEYLLRNSVWYRGTNAEESMRFSGELDANGIGWVAVHCHGEPLTDTTVTPFCLIRQSNSEVKYTILDTVTVVQVEWLQGLLALTNTLRTNCYNFERTWGRAPRSPEDSR